MWSASGTWTRALPYVAKIGVFGPPTRSTVLSASLKVPIWRTFGRVTAPICLPSILDIAIYLFVNAMTTVSSVIFLYAPDTKLASVAAVNIEESGATAVAAALCIVIVITSAAVKALHVLADRFLLGRLQAWRRR